MTGLDVPLSPTPSLHSESSSLGRSTSSVFASLLDRWRTPSTASTTTAKSPVLARAQLHSPRSKSPVSSLFGDEKSVGQGSHSSEALGVDVNEGEGNDEGDSSFSSSSETDNEYSQLYLRAIPELSEGESTAPVTPTTLQAPTSPSPESPVFKPALVLSMPPASEADKDMVKGGTSTVGKSVSDTASPKLSAVALEFAPPPVVQSHIPSTALPPAKSTPLATLKPEIPPFVPRTLSDTSSTPSSPISDGPSTVLGLSIHGDPKNGQFGFAYPDTEGVWEDVDEEQGDEKAPPSGSRYSEKEAPLLTFPKATEVTIKPATGATAAVPFKPPTTKHALPARPRIEESVVKDPEVPEKSQSVRRASASSLHSVKSATSTTHSSSSSVPVISSSYKTDVDAAPKPATIRVELYQSPGPSAPPPLPSYDAPRNWNGPAWTPPAPWEQYHPAYGQGGAYGIASNFRSTQDYWMAQQAMHLQAASVAGMGMMGPQPPPRAPPQQPPSPPSPALVKPYIPNRVTLPTSVQEFKSNFPALPPAGSSSAPGTPAWKSSSSSQPEIPKWVEMANADMKTFQARVAALEKENQALREGHERSQNEKAEEKANAWGALRLKERVDEVAVLKARLEKVASDRHHESELAEKAKDDLKQSHRMLKGKIDVLTQDAGTWLSQLMSTSSFTYSVIAATLTKTFAKAEEELAESKKIVRGLTTEKLKLEMDIATERRKAAAARDIVDPKIEELQKEVLRLKSELDRKSNSLVALRETADDLEKTTDRLEEEKEDMMEELIALEDALKQAIADNATAAQSAASLANIKTEFLKMHNEKVLSDAQVHEKAIKKYVDLYEGKLAEVKRVTEEMNAGLRGEVKRLELVKANYEAQVRTATQQQNTIRMERDTYLAASMEAGAIIEALEAQCNESASKMKELESALSEVMNHVDEMHQSNVKGKQVSGW